MSKIKQIAMLVTVGKPLTITSSIRAGLNLKNNKNSRKRKKMKSNNNKTKRRKNKNKMRNNNGKTKKRNKRENEKVLSRVFQGVCLTFSMVFRSWLIFVIHQPAPYCFKLLQVGSPFFILGIHARSSWNITTT